MVTCIGGETFIGYTVIDEPQIPQQQSTVLIAYDGLSDFER